MHNKRPLPCAAAFFCSEAAGEGIGLDEGGDRMKGSRISVRWQAALLGCGVGLLTAVCACAGAAGLMVRGAVGLETMGLWAAGITVGSGLLGSLAAMLGGGSTLDAALAALGELVVLFALNAVLCGGEMEGVAVTALALAGGCGAAVLLRLGKGGGRKRRRRSKNR